MRLLLSQLLVFALSFFFMGSTSACVESIEQGTSPFGLFPMKIFQPEKGPSRAVYLLFSGMEIRVDDNANYNALSANLCKEGISLVVQYSPVARLATHKKCKQAGWVHGKDPIDPADPTTYYCAAPGYVHTVTPAMEIRFTQSVFEHVRTRFPGAYIYWNAESENGVFSLQAIAEKRIHPDAFVGISVPMESFSNLVRWQLVDRSLAALIRADTNHDGTVSLKEMDRAIAQEDFDFAIPTSAYLHEWSPEDLAKEATRLEEGFEHLRKCVITSDCQPIIPKYATDTDALLRWRLQMDQPIVHLLEEYDGEVILAYGGRDCSIPADLQIQTIRTSSVARSGRLWISYYPEGGHGLSSSCVGADANVFQAVFKEVLRIIRRDIDAAARRRAGTADSSHPRRVNSHQTVRIEHQTSRQSD